MKEKDGRKGRKVNEEIGGGKLGIGGRKGGKVNEEKEGGGDRN